jgi:Cu/Zn superoxide dismutase
MKTLLTLLAAVVATAGLSYAAAPQTITVQMKALNHSGETGTATLTQEAKGVKVTVDIKGAPAASQPTHIHPGTCTKLNPAPEAPLSPLDNGKSVTMLSGKKLSDFTGGKFSINVHKSSNDLKTYVSCGEIK